MAKRSGAVHVATTSRRYKNRVYQTHLLRRTFRHDGKVKHQTVGNVSHLPPDLIETIRRRLQGEEPLARGGFDILRSLPHGHVAAVLGTLRSIGLENIVASRPSPERSLIVAMIVARVIDPRSKLATARALRAESGTTSLALELGIELAADRDLYSAMDWLLARQPAIEKKLAHQHLHDGSLILYDVSSSFYTGTHCPLAQFGHNRDGKNGYPQIIYGLLCNAEGCPIAIEVFEGNTSDPETLQAQVDKVRRRFRIERVTFVGDRGLITAKRIEETLRGVEGLTWITALRADSIAKLVGQGTIQPSLFDERDLLEVESPDYPGERLVVCRNPFLAENRARKRQDLLEATERKLDEIVAATARERRPLRGKEKIALRVGRNIDHYKVGKHFQVEIDEASFSYHREEEKIAAEAALDGLYVIRSSVGADLLSAEGTVRAYKLLAQVERAFRSMKTIDLRVRPIFHWLGDRVRAHVFLCMLAYYVEWEMRQRLAPILFDDDDRGEAESLRASIVAPAQRSRRARRKETTKRTDRGEPVHSFRTLLADLGTLARNLVRAGGPEGTEFSLLTRPTELQQRAFELLGVPSGLSRAKARK